ncbi:MAG: hypothetical protein IAE77_16785 [Prosthecobacter sp.]|jgi:hypothetical protein|uniref:hypothetical protein n=1 Tax=Prosthecobacter sp. TaxID=1965333 RepID=UPI001A02CB94|nr:hypothetical protein [Prosthecobacter sp.]MBE2285118.1 hypothetical protein [Prosthecobacter sp.]
MRTSLFLPLVAAVFCTADGLLAQTASAAASGYEKPPVLKASEILQPVYLSSPFHRVREDVIPDQGSNHFVIDSDFGLFIAHGNQMLHDRVKEIFALVRLREMSNTQEFAEGVKQAAMAPLQAADHLISDPAETLTSTMQGVGKFLGRVGRGAKQVVTGEERANGQDGMLKAAAGVSSTKRQLCAELGVSPYSTNELLQDELDRVAWVMFAGRMTVKAATMPISGAAGAALSALNTVDTTTQMVYDQSPSDLQALNLSRLRNLGISEDAAKAFLATKAFSPWHQTHFVSSLEKMTGVKGREILLRDATSMCENEADAVFYQQTTLLISHAHIHGIPVDRIALVNGMPVCIGADGGLVVALHWDYAMWSPRSKRFAEAVQAMRVDGAKPSSLIVVLTGVMSPGLRQELEARGFRVQDKLLKGPLN